MSFSAYVNERKSKKLAEKCNLGFVRLYAGESFAAIESPGRITSTEWRSTKRQRTAATAAANRGTAEELRN